MGILSVNQKITTTTNKQKQLQTKTRINNYKKHQKKHTPHYLCILLLPVIETSTRVTDSLNTSYFHLYHFYRSLLLCHVYF